MHARPGSSRQYSVPPPQPRPVIGIDADLITHNDMVRTAAPRAYSEAVIRAGGVPLILPPIPGSAARALALCDALVLTGGDDPQTESFGAATDPRITPVHPDRQAFLEELVPGIPEDLPVLGVCLGMQMMALDAGGELDQFMPESTPTHAEHWGQIHPVVFERSWPLSHDSEPTGVSSKHKQAITDPGSLVVGARAHDGVIEAVIDPNRRFYLGVQWHPERTEDDRVGMDLFRAIVRAARPGAGGNC